MSENVKKNMYSKVQRRKRNSSGQATVAVKSKPFDLSKEKRDESMTFLSYFKSEMPKPSPEVEKNDESVDSDAHMQLEKLQEPEEILPLVGAGWQWYKEKGVNSAANMASSEERMKSSVIMHDNEMKGLLRGSGTLSQNVDVLIEKLTTAGSLVNTLLKMAC